ncbi:MAG: MarR family winged helix-turn-helix transcriptional regulator [Acidobacteriota bacterium]|nr:MarR family winged helix-turn-helix transcriptional regulator [Acidobacteriota bacterium]
MVTEAIHAPAARTLSTGPTARLNRTQRTRALAEFRYTLRRFLHFSEQAAERAGLTPQQHQLLLQIAGAPPDAVNTIGFLAARLALKHHSLVELATRCEEAGWILRRPGTLDRRVVVLHLTVAGSRILHELSEDHEQELHELAPRLIQALGPFTRRPGARA